MIGGGDGGVDAEVAVREWERAQRAAVTRLLGDPEQLIQGYIDPASVRSMIAWLLCASVTGVGASLGEMRAAAVRHGEARRRAAARSVEERPGSPVPWGGTPEAPDRWRLIVLLDAFARSIEGGA